MLGRGFFERDVLEVAEGLVGTELVWGKCAGMVVETEAYAAEGDAAAHMAFRPSARAFMEACEAGTAYVYLNYGMYWLANVLVKGGEGRDGIILIRALEPRRGIGVMKRRRRKERVGDLCSGPGKLVIAMGIGREDHGRSLVASEAACFRAGTGEVVVERDRRVGISKAKDLRWRFMAKGNGFVSVRKGKAQKNRAGRKTRRGLVKD
ncbi:MAG: DNA-3-methyladenine glycosylase [Verrucomicrobiota bacterium]